MKAPFLYFGGKSSIADKIWAALGQPGHYIEPFFGSGAVLQKHGARGADMAGWLKATARAKKTGTGKSSGIRRIAFLPKIKIYSKWPIPKRNKPIKQAARKTGRKRND